MYRDKTYATPTPVLIPGSLTDDTEISDEALALYVRIASGWKNVDPSLVLNELLERRAVSTCPHCDELIVT